MKKIKSFRILIFFLFICLSGFFIFRFITVVKPFQFFIPTGTILSPQSKNSLHTGGVKFSFAIIGDPENQLDNLQKALEKIKAMELESVVIVGDLTSTGTSKEFKAIEKKLDDFELDFYLIPGNHDLWYEREQGVDVFSQYFGQRYYAEEINDYQFIFLDNADEWQGFEDKQLSWLEHYLFLSKDFMSGKMEGKYLVFTHIPFWHPENKKAMGEYSQAMKDQAYEMLQKFCQSPPLAIFSGHLHKTGDYNYGCGNGQQIRMINAGSIHEIRNLQLPRFLQMTILTGGQLQVEELEISKSR